jgi:hypothetical protein
VGGGLGDIAEVLDAGRLLRGAGHPTILYRPPNRPMPKDVDGPWDFAGVERRRTLAPRGARALTVAPNWGVSAAPDRPGPLGRGGVWSLEADAVERRYGAERTLHVSLEEFARTLTSREENAERWREGGRTTREISRSRPTRRFRVDAERFHRAFREFRAFDRRNVLHLFQTFCPNPAFHREFPEAVQLGPIWPEPLPSPSHSRRSGSEWVWYASPSTSQKLVDPIDQGLRATPVRRVRVRSPRPIRFPPNSAITWIHEPPAPTLSWRRKFGAAGLRIVTGSRSLLEALAGGGPFLYSNGLLGDGPRRRRHRPEKIRALLAGWRAEGASPRVVRDLDDFSRGRRIAEVVRDVASDASWTRDFPTTAPVEGFPLDRADGGAYLIRVARTFAEGPETAPNLVGRLRSEGAVHGGH